MQINFLNKGYFPDEEPKINTSSIESSQFYDNSAYLGGCCKKYFIIVSKGLYLSKMTQFELKYVMFYKNYAKFAGGLLIILIIKF